MRNEENNTAHAADSRESQVREQEVVYQKPIDTTRVPPVVVAPAAVPLPERHGSELGHHFGVAHKRDRRQRARRLPPADGRLALTPRTDGKLLPGSLGHTQAVRLNRHTPGHVVSVPI